MAVGVLLMAASGAIATPLKVCVPEKEGATLKTPKAGVCAAKYKPSRLLSEPEAEELEEIKKHMKYEPSGAGGKPTVLLSGVNVQLVGRTHAELEEECWTTKQKEKLEETRRRTGRVPELWP